MGSQATLAQGTEITVSTEEVTDVAITPAPLAEALQCITKQVQYQPGTKAEIDITTLCSTAKEFLLGLKDPGNLTLTGFYKSAHAGFKVLKQADKDNKSRLFTITFPDQTVIKVLGRVQQIPWSLAAEGVVDMTCTIRLTGEAVEVGPPVTP